MKVTHIYLSAPQVKFAEYSLNNQQVLDRIEDNFKGEKRELRRIKSGISMVFKYCGTNIRFLGTAAGKKPLDYAIEVSKEVCHENGLDPSLLDLVIYGGIFRDYFEPATAMEITAGLGIKKAHVFDVTTACAGLLQSVNVAASLMMADPSIKTALCCTTDFPDEAISFDIQSFEELSLKAAGLTLGSGAAAWLLTREPGKGGSAQLREIQNTSIAAAFRLCQVPVSKRRFISQSKEVFDLGLEHVPGEIRNIAKKVNWEIDDIDYFISHQPSERIIHQICDILDIPHEKAPVTHHLYGNTVNVSVPMTLDYLLKNKYLKDGHKIILSSAAAGFTMITIAAEWVQ
ncbi:MAG: hypothetical protein JXI33_06815 [Candidatus Aminicenantes bacterium]|nr:hypothetical protein [Candidatus Aminicenantes bacterium]